MQTTARTRIAALFAAIGISTLLAASQFGMASHYAAQADAVLARAATCTTLAQAAPAGPRQPV